MRAWINVATLVKLRNSKGRFAARAAAGLPFLLQEGDEVALVPPQTDVPRNLTVDQVTETADGTADITFAEELTYEQAQALVGMRCLIERSLVDDSVFEEAPGAWEGWRVLDEALGELGVVVGLVENPAQALLRVERADGQGELLIPVVDEIILAVDVDSQLVRVRVPNGLLDL